MGLNVVDTLNAHTKKGLPISEIASEILWQQLNSADGHTLGPIKVTATTLAALAIFADMIDGFIEAETGRRSSRVRKSWQARQRRLLRMFTAEVSRDVRINAAKISSDFRISLGRSAEVGIGTAMAAAKVSAMNISTRRAHSDV